MEKDKEAAMQRAWNTILDRVNARKTARYLGHFPSMFSLNESDCTVCGYHVFRVENVITVLEGSATWIPCPGNVDK